jgi:hypothetical protein
MEEGWLKPILEQASADWETWPAWQRGLEIKVNSEKTELSESNAHNEVDSGDREAAA